MLTYTHRGFTTDFCLSNGKIQGFSEDEKQTGAGIGATYLEDALGFDVDHLQTSSGNQSVLWVTKKENKTVKIKFLKHPYNLRDNAGYQALQMLTHNQGSLRVIPVRDQAGRSTFALLVKGRRVDIAHMDDVIQTPLIKLNSQSATDYISHAFVTGRIPDVTLHYLEHSTLFRNSTEQQHTYNVFRMPADFWRVIEVTHGIPPID